MNKTFCCLIVISFLFSVYNLVNLFNANPETWVPMVVTDNITYLQSGNSYVNTKYCKIDDQSKCIVERVLRSEPEFAVGTNVNLKIREKFKFDSTIGGWMNFLIISVFIEGCVILVGVFFMGSVYIFMPKVETTRQDLL